MTKQTNITLMITVLWLALMTCAVCAQQANEKLFGVHAFNIAVQGSTPERVGQLQYLGAKVVRLPVTWHLMEERGKGQTPQWFWDALDANVSAAERAGAKLIIELAQTPCWASSDPRRNCGSLSYDVRYAPTNPNDYADAFARIAQRYRGRVLAYEIWNEPNLVLFWPGNAARPATENDPWGSFVGLQGARDYANLVKAAYPRLKSADSNAVVLAGSIAGGDTAYLNELYRAGIKGSFDALSMHPYTGTYPVAQGQPNYGKSYGPNECPGNTTGLRYWCFKSGVEQMRALMLREGDDKKIWFTEFGFSSTSEWNGSGWEGQATHLRESFALIRTWDFVPVACWYAISDVSVSNAREAAFGLYTLSNQIKPSGLAFREEAAKVVTPPAPVKQKPVPLAPSNNTEVTTATPSFVWQSSPGAVRYKLWLNEYGTPNVPGKIDRDFTPTEAGCAAGGSCTVNPGVRLAAAPAQWWVTAYFADGTSLLSDGASFSVKAATTQPTTGQVIYDDALRNSWQDVSWSTRNFSATQFVRTGSRSISATFTAPWQALSVYHPAFDTTPYSELVFWIHGGGVAGRNLIVQGKLGNDPQYIIRLDPYITGGTVGANEWRQVRIPLSALGVSNKANCTGFWIQEASGKAQPTFYVDDVMLVSGSSTTPPPVSTITEKVLDDFEGAVPTSAWSFYNGADFPGLTGSFALGAGYSGRGARIGYSFTNNTGFVAAYLNLSAPLATPAIGLRVKSPAGIRVILRVVDASGQTLQYSLTRPLTAQNPDSWYRHLVNLAAPSLWWGGANNGKVQGAVRQVWILAADPLDKGLKGEIVVDDVVAVTSDFTVALNPNATVAPPANSGDYAARAGIHLRTTEDVRAYNAAQSAGFTWVRMDLLWREVERQRGVYDFARYDRIVALAEARGLKPFFILAYSNPLYIPCNGSDSCPPRTTEQLQAYGNFAEAVARRYAGRGLRYEVWNEPNISLFWGNTTTSANEYAALAREAIARIHRADPNAKVSTAGLSTYDFPYFRTMFAAGGLQGADAIGVHPYSLPKPPEIAIENHLLLQALVQQTFGAGKAIWDTEWGYSSTSFGNGQAADARTKQAVFTARRMLTGWALGFPMTVNYNLVDEGTNAANVEHNFGLLDTNYNEKPAMRAVRTLFTIAKGRTLTGLVQTDIAGLHAIKLSGATDTVIALWYDALGEVSVTLPAGARAVNCLGDGVALATVNGKPTLTVRETSGPVYVTIQ